MRKIALLFGIAAAVVGAACGRQVTPNPAGLGPGGTPAGFVNVFYNVAVPFKISAPTSTTSLLTRRATATLRLPTRSKRTGTATPILWSPGGMAGHLTHRLWRSTIPHKTLISRRFGFRLLRRRRPSSTILTPTVREPRFRFARRSRSSAIIQCRLLLRHHLALSQIWTFNAFVAQANGSGQWYFVDSMGAGGPVDPQFVSPRLDMSTCFDNTYYPAHQATQISSIEIANNPSKAPCSGSDVTRRAYVAVPPVPGASDLLDTKLVR